MLLQLQAKCKFLGACLASCIGVCHIMPASSVCSGCNHGVNVTVLVLNVSSVLLIGDVVKGGPAQAVMWVL